ncbi:MAG: hypothetical protein WC889_19845 [Myxococcota bacterium]
MTVKEAILKEIETMPEGRQRDVLSFIRFVKIGLSDSAGTSQRFETAISHIRDEAKKRGITEDDIAAEIAACRQGR